MALQPTTFDSSKSGGIHRARRRLSGSLRRHYAIRCTGVVGKFCRCRITAKLISSRRVGKLGRGGVHLRPNGPGRTKQPKLSTSSLYEPERMSNHESWPALCVAQMRSPSPLPLDMFKLEKKGNVREQSRKPTIYATGSWASLCEGVAVAYGGSISFQGNF